MTTNNNMDSITTVSSLSTSDTGSARGASSRSNGNGHAHGISPLDDITAANHNNVRFAPLPAKSPDVGGRSLSVRTGKSMQIEVSLDQLRSPTSKDLEASADNDLDSKKMMHPFTLTFRPSQLKHINLEAEYQIRYFDDHRYAIFTALLFAVLVWIIFGCVDIYKYYKGTSTNYHDFVSTISLRAACAAVGLIVIFSVLRQSWVRYNGRWKWIVALTMLAFGTSQILFGIFQKNETDATFTIILILIPSMSATFFALSFVHCLVHNWLLLALYIILTASYPGASALNSTDALKKKFVQTVIGVAIGNVIFCVHAYKHDFNKRKDFLGSKQLERAEARVEKTLTKMLPSSIIKQLRSLAGDEDEFIYQYHQTVSVLFAHICEFDEHTAHLSPQQIVALLNKVFSKFDELTDMHDVYKVETIGDVYLVASGCPREFYRPDHAAILSVVATAMHRAIDDPELQAIVAPNILRLKIGIHSGTVIAGVVGSKYPRYRLMGDTVNTASRMSTTCLPGMTQLSKWSKDLLPKGQFEYEEAGPIAVKGKGDMYVYRLLPAKEQVYDWKAIKTGLPEETDDHDGSDTVPSSPNDTKNNLESPAIDQAIRDTAKSIQALPQAGYASVKLKKKQQLQQAHAHGHLKKEGTSRSLLTKRASVTLPANVDWESHSAAAVVASQNDVIKSFFTMPPIEEILYQSRPWYLLWSLHFGRKWHRLETQFRSWYFQKYQEPNQRWTLFITCVLLVLSAYDYTSDPERNETNNLALAWIPRTIGIVIGLAHFIFTFHPTFEKHMQISTMITLICLGWAFTSTSIILTAGERLTLAFTISILLILSSLVSMFVGLRFKYSVVASFWILLFYLIAGLSTDHKMGVFLLLLAGAAFYNRAAYQHEAFTRQTYMRLVKQESEKDKVQHILDNMLPVSVLKQVQSMTDGEIFAREFKPADVLFSDIVGFTSIASRLRPEAVVAILNLMFGSFDALTTRYRVYKVETIGDAYLACTGVVPVLKERTRKHTSSASSAATSVNDDDNYENSVTSNLCDWALAAQDAMSLIHTPDGTPLKIRVGIHTGQVVAGVVGRKMPRYHLFGETVTIAEEMEQRGVAGRVSISQVTYDHLAELKKLDEYEFTPQEDTKLANGHLMPRYLIANKGYAALQAAEAMRSSPSTLVHNPPIAAATTTTGAPAFNRAPSVAPTITLPHIMVDINTSPRAPSGSTTSSVPSSSSSNSMGHDDTGRTANHSSSSGIISSSSSSSLSASVHVELSSMATTSVTIPLLVAPLSAPPCPPLAPAPPVAILVPLPSLPPSPNTPAAGREAWAKEQGEVHAMDGTSLRLHTGTSPSLQSSPAPSSSSTSSSSSPLGV